MNEFVWQDVELTDEFKNQFTKYLRKNNYDIEFLGATAVITSSITKYIYFPNHWLFIASYAVDVFEELQRYKEYFKQVAARLNKQPVDYAKYLRDSATAQDKVSFINCARMVFSSQFSDADVVEEAASRLWRFVNDYAWLPFSPFLFQQRIGYWNSFRVARTHTSNGHNL